MDRGRRRDSLTVTPVNKVAGAIPSLRTIACLLPIGFLAAPWPAQTQTMTRAQIDEMISAIGAEDLEEMVAAQQFFLSNGRLHAADHPLTLWSDQLFRDHIDEEVRINQAVLTDARGELSEELLREFTAQMSKAPPGEHGDPVVRAAADGIARLSWASRMVPGTASRFRIPCSVSPVTGIGSAPRMRSRPRPAARAPYPSR